MHSWLLRFTATPPYTLFTTSFITSVFSIIASSFFTIICTIVCTIIFSIKKIHQRKSIFALSSFPSRKSIKRNPFLHYQKIPSNKSIKGNPFLHYHFFHQKNPSYALSRKSITSSSFFSINFFHHHLGDVICGGKSELPTMHKAPHRIFIHNFYPSSTRRSLASIMFINLVNRRGTLIGWMLDE